MKNPYPICTTEAIVLHTKALGEANRRVVLLTKDKGKVEVLAKSVRKEGAKLKAIAYPYQLIYVSLVCGKQYILKEGSVKDTLFSIWEDSNRYTIYVRILQLIERAVSETHEGYQYFTLLEKAIEMLKTADEKTAQACYLFVGIKVFSELGLVEDLLSKDIVIGVESILASNKTKKQCLEDLAQGISYSKV